MSGPTGILADPAEAACLSLPGVQSRNEPSHLPVTLRQSGSLDILRIAELMNPAPLTGDPSISSEEIREEHIEPLSPPEVTPNHLREIDHVWRRFLDPVLLLILLHSECQSTF